TVNDGNSGEDTASVVVTVNAVNDAPIVNADPVVVTEENTSVTVDVVTNDTDSEGDTLTVITAFTQNGDVVINPDGTLTYIPNDNFNGPDSITYTVSDGKGGEASSTVKVMVTAVEYFVNADNFDFGRESNMVNTSTSFSYETLNYEPLLLDAVNGISLLPGYEYLFPIQPNLNLIGSFSAFEASDQSDAINRLFEQENTATPLSEVDQALQSNELTNSDAAVLNVTEGEQNVTLNESPQATPANNSKLFNEQLAELPKKFSNEIENLSKLFS
ncbi:Ig-like domain-containing protein, partial [Gammaproteobacteria bacterium AS21]